MDESVDYFTTRMRLIAFLLGAVGLVAAVAHSIFWPPKPPPQSWADGIYQNDCCAPLVLRNGLITSEGRTTSYKVENGKKGYFVDIPEGISVQTGHVLFGGTLAYVQFNKVSDLEPAVHDAYAMHIYSQDDGRDYVFSKR